MLITAVGIDIQGVIGIDIQLFWNKSNNSALFVFSPLGNPKTVKKQSQ